MIETRAENGIRWGHSGENDGRLSSQAIEPFEETSSQSVSWLKFMIRNNVVAPWVSSHEFDATLRVFTSRGEATRHVYRGYIALQVLGTMYTNGRLMD